MKQKLSGKVFSVCPARCLQLVYPPFHQTYQPHNLLLLINTNACLHHAWGGYGTPGGLWHSRLHAVKSRCMCCGGVVLVLLHKYYRSISLGLAKDKGESKLERESWMIELPANKKTFGMLIYSPCTAHLHKCLGRSWA